MNAVFLRDEDDCDDSTTDVTLGFVEPYHARFSHSLRDDDEGSIHNLPRRDRVRCSGRLFAGSIQSDTGDTKCEST